MQRSPVLCLKSVVFSVFLTVAGMLHEARAESVPADTAAVEASEQKRNIIQKLVAYFSDANKVHEPKKLDFSIIGGPYYASDTKLGIGIVAAGIYRRNLADTINPAGQFNIYGDVSVNGYFKVGIRGNQMIRSGRDELTYDASFESRPDLFWGIGYDMARCDSNRTDFKRWRANVDMAYLFQIAPDFYLGPRLLVDYLIAKKVSRPELWQGQSLRTFTGGIGFAVMYDSRDNVFNAYSGFYARLDQTFAPGFIGNRYAFSATEITLSHYQPLWKGCVMASRLHSRFTYGDTPWGLMSKFGGSYSMRGYYDGRYNDKCEADLTVEFRQHIWRRNGAVVWAGIGEVFPKLNRIGRGPLLWNWGVGYRWEFKKRVNVRIDYGFGRGQHGLIFSINEAF